MYLINSFKSCLLIKNHFTYFKNNIPKIKTKHSFEDINCLIQFLESEMTNFLKIM